MTINMTTFTYPVELSVTEQPIKLTISNLMYQASGVSSVNAKTGNVVLTASDVGADVAGTANDVLVELQPQIDTINQQLPNLATQNYVLTALTPKATVTQLNEVKALAEINQLNIGTKVDQIDFDSVSDTVTAQGLTLLNKADIATLTTLAQLVNTKADQSYVVSEIARITGNAPAALDTLAEIAEQLGNDQTQINNLLDQIGNRVRFDAAQALTAPQQTQVRDNINAEAKGVAASLVSGVTVASIGAATTAQGVKADSALQSADVAPVALSGSFSDLVNKSSLFSLVYSAYVIGSNVAIAASDTLGQMLGKLQAQINSNVTAINTKEPSITSGTTTQYWRGDKTWRTLGTAATRDVGIAANGNVPEYQAAGGIGGTGMASSYLTYATFDDVPKRGGFFGPVSGSSWPAPHGAYAHGIRVLRTTSGSGNYCDLFLPYGTGTNKTIMSLRTMYNSVVTDQIVYTSANPIIYTTPETTAATARIVTVQSTGEMRSLAPIATQAASTATDVATLTNDLNALLVKLKASGLML